jgi:hypothetical protein
MTRSSDRQCWPELDGIARDEIGKVIAPERCATCRMTVLFPLSDADIDSEKSSAIRALCGAASRIQEGFAERARADSQEHRLYSRSGRHSSAVEQLFRKQHVQTAELVQTVR